jgi:tetratricopeptide (TPR) repeat protein
VAAPPPLRRAIGFYERAVQLDSMFEPAWARLSIARTNLYGDALPDPVRGAQALAAAERARRLNPNDPMVYRAFGAYHASVPPVDLARARGEYEPGLRRAPGDGHLLGVTAGAEMAAGRWDSAAVRLDRATVLDPQSVYIAISRSDVRRSLRQYAAADSAADRAIALAPTNPRGVGRKVMAAAARGDLAAARAAVRAGAQRIDPAALFSYLAIYYDMYWVLDDDQQRQVLELPPSAYGDDRGTWGIVRAQIYHLRGDRTRTMVYADSARIGFLEHLKGAPDDPQQHVFLGLALAYLGRAAEAEQEGRRAVELAGEDATIVPYVRHQLVRIYLGTGQPEKALDELEALLKVPYDLSPGWLRVDPTFDPLRSNPRFKKLVEAPPGSP